MENLKVHFSTKTNPLMVILIAFVTFLQVLVFFPCYLYQCALSVYVKWYKREFGKMLDSISSLMNDDYCKDPSNTSVVCILTIDGTLALQQVRDRFDKHVLQAKLPGNEGKLQYPELKQYQVTYMGHRFWRNEPSFLLEHHITEKNHPTICPSSLAGVYQEMMAKTYATEKSPWEVILIRNFKFEGEAKKKSLLVFRFHHSMGDGRSFLKLIVEGVFKTPLKSATANEVEKTLWERFSYYLHLPYAIFWANAYFYLLEECTNKHPWRVHNVRGDWSPFVVALSPRISLLDVKHTAKRNHVCTSSIIMAILTAAMSRFDERLAQSKFGMPALWTLPKQGHPAFLTNHFYIGLPFLPTDETRPFQRLQKCNSAYNTVRFSDFCRYMELLAILVSSWIVPVKSRMAPVSAVTLGVTNIAGCEDEISIGGISCSDFGACAATPKSSMGVGFTILSYKHSIQLTLAAKRSIMDEIKLEKLAALIGEEAEAILEKA